MIFKVLRKKLFKEIQNILVLNRELLTNFDRKILKISSSIFYKIKNSWMVTSFEKIPQSNIVMKILPLSPLSRFYHT